MKKTTLLPLMLVPLMLASCGTTTSNSETLPSTTEERPKSVQIIRDNKFQGGFTAVPGSGTRQDDGWTPEDKWPINVNLLYGDATKETVSWVVAQHGDIYSLNDKYNAHAGGKPTYENGYYTFKDESKEMSVNPDTGNLYLELNTSKEYVRPRRSSESWCHILLTQGFTTPIRLDEVESLDFTIDLEMKKFEDHMGSDFNAGLHCAQFLMYIVVKSENAIDANSYFWFGLPFFDNRYPNGIPESSHVDSGFTGSTSKVIYNMPTSDIFKDGGVKLNQKSCGNVDIKPFFGRALLEARRLGQFTNSNLSDLTFESMNIGFEVPGTYDIGMEISNFALTANYKD